jgi:ABC-type multidrug transport system fused ATPase/permease subunit
LIVLATSFSAVILRQVSLSLGSGDAGYGRSLTPSLVGLSLSYSLQLCALFQWCIRQSAEVENQLTSVERIHEYGLIPAEGRRSNDSAEHPPPPADWPQQGEIVFENVQMRYRENLPLVLNGLEVAVQPQDKIGICGRTGAGKSSLLSLLFRLVEPCGGRVLIDGVDTQSLGLLDLRSKLSIIPQEPVIFSGTLRYNLDPVRRAFSGIFVVLTPTFHLYRIVCFWLQFDQYSDEAVWEALRAVQLADMVQAHPAGLGMPMAEYGSNLSAGECQLVCVARALLKPVKILLVDEVCCQL